MILPYDTPNTFLYIRTNLNGKTHRHRLYGRPVVHRGVCSIWVPVSSLLEYNEKEEKKEIKHQIPPAAQAIW